jgi:hypothetical protein
MSTMAISARWEFDLRIGKGKGASQETAEEKANLPRAALPESGKMSRRWFGRSLISFAIPLGAELIKWFFRIHGLPI